MNTKDLLTAIAKKDTLSIQESFNAIMAEKTKVMAEEILSEQAMLMTAGVTLVEQDEV